MVDKQNDTKPGKKPGSFLHIDCTREDKTTWVNAARGQKLAAWVIDALNDAAKKQGDSD